MSAIAVGDELVHYEVLGRGKPILLVHGWLGSWRYWVPTMQQLAMKYRCYAIDLWGFGDSGKDKRLYDFDQQVELLDEFIELMGFPRVVIVGHGLGAAIAAQYGVNTKTKKRVHRLLAISPPLIGEVSQQVTQALSTNAAETIPHGNVRTELLARLAENEKGGTNQTPAIRNPNPTAATPKPSLKSLEQFNNKMQAIFGDLSLEELLGLAIDSSRDDYSKLKGEVKKTDRLAVDESLKVFGQRSFFEHLMNVPAPVCVVLGDNDRLMPKPSEAILHSLNNRHQLKLLTMSNIRHFPMLEAKARFVRLLKDFLEADNVETLDMKEEWRRRKR